MKTNKQKHQSVDRRYRRYPFVFQRQLVNIALKKYGFLRKGDWTLKMDSGGVRWHVRPTDDDDDDDDGDDDDDDVQK